MGAYEKEMFSGSEDVKVAIERRWPFQVFEKTNDIVYKLNLPSEHNIFPIFNISDHSLFYTDGDSRMNPFENEGNDVIHGTRASKDKDLLIVEK